MSCQEYRTPKKLFDLLESEVVCTKFTLDAAASKENAKCEKFYTVEDNALTKPWPGVVFCNPPFKKFGDWIAKAHEEAYVQKSIVCMIGPVGCSQSWFHVFAQQGTILVPRKRISFDDAVTGAPTKGADRDSMIYLFGNRFWNSASKFRMFSL